MKLNKIMRKSIKNVPSETNAMQNRQIFSEEETMFVPVLRENRHLLGGILHSPPLSFPGCLNLSLSLLTEQNNTEYCIIYQHFVWLK